MNAADNHSFCELDLITSNQCFVPHAYVNTAQAFNDGDSFTGTVHISDHCSKLPDHKAAIVISHSAGNIFKAGLIAKVGDKVLSYELKGFFHMASRKMILVPERHNSRTMGLVCDFSTDENSANCALLRDNLSEKCGSVSIQRDYSGTHCHSTCNLYAT